MSSSGPLGKKNTPMEQPSPRAKADQPKQSGGKWDPAGQESKATRQRRHTETLSSTSLISKIITGCGIVKAPYFWKRSISYRWVLLLICIITSCYGYYGDDYNLYYMRNIATHGESYLYADSIEKCWVSRISHHTRMGNDIKGSSWAAQQQGHYHHHQQQYQYQQGALSHAQPRGQHTAPTLKARPRGQHSVLITRAQHQGQQATITLLAQAYAQQQQQVVRRRQ